MLRFTNEARDASGNVVYSNRGAIFARAEWGKIKYQEDYEDTQRVVAFDEYLASHETTRAVKDPASPPGTYDIEDVRRQYIGFETAQRRAAIQSSTTRSGGTATWWTTTTRCSSTRSTRKGLRTGRLLCPPSGWLALYFASLGPWPAVFEPLFPIVPTPGKRIVNMSQEVEWSVRIKVGDHLSVRRRIADVFQKAVSLDPEAVWIVAEAVITNQHGEEVCVIRNTLLTHRTAEEQGSGNEEQA